VGVFVLLPLLAIAAVVALWGWRWHSSATVESALSAAADSTQAAAHGRQLRRAPVPPAPPPAAPIAAGRAADAGPPVVLTLKALQSMFDVSKLLQRNAAEAAANVERYCAEAAKLPKHIFDDPPDAGAGPLRDAAYFMEPLVTWETHPPSEGLLQLPQPLVDRIRAAGRNWATQLSAADTAGLDFDWLAQLQSYDYWSLASAGAVADQAATIDPLMAPIPDYRPLIYYAKLRLVRALAYGDLGIALAQVQHLADIVHSNGITIAEFEAARIVSLEQPFQTAAVAQGYPPLNSGGDAAPAAPLDSAGYDQFHDLTMAGVAFALPGVDDAVFQRAMGCTPSPCAAITDAVALHRELDRLSDRGDDDPFWSFADGHACDAPLVDLLKASPSGGLENLASWLGGEPLPLEKLFGPGIAPNAAK
jgi:hypothetical protein